MVLDMSLNGVENDSFLNGVASCLAFVRTAPPAESG